ncbi:hypothetical protein CR513_21984, partial [Mucuna pruriens]
MLDVFLVFKEFKAQMELEPSKRINCLRIDNGGEYVNDDFLAFCKQGGISRQFTIPHTPQRNGVVEQMNKTLLERTRVMLRITERCGKENQLLDYSSLHVFGCPMYVMYNSPKRTKQDPKSRKCIFLDYVDNVMGYRLWHSTTHKVVISRDVQNDSTTKDITIVKIESTKEHKEQEYKEQEPNKVNDDEAWRTTCEIRKPSWHSNYVMASLDAYCLLAKEGESSTFQKALKKWKHYIEIRHRNLLNTQKARKSLVVNRFIKSNEMEQSCGTVSWKIWWSKEILRKKIFSLITRLVTIRVVLIMCVAFDLHLEQLDVKIAFLREELEDEIYAPRCWYKRFDSFIISLGYNRLSSDHCTYYNRFGNTDFVILLLYVDDMLVVGPNKDRIQELKAQLAREFDMKDLGPANKILGMQIHRDRKDRKI